MIVQRRRRLTIRRRIGRRVGLAVESLKKGERLRSLKKRATMMRRRKKSMKRKIVSNWEAKRIILRSLTNSKNRNSLNKSLKSKPISRLLQLSSSLISQSKYLNGCLTRSLMETICLSLSETSGRQPLSN